MSSQAIYGSNEKNKIFNMPLSVFVISFIFFYYMHTFTFKFGGLMFSSSKIWEYLIRCILPVFYLILNYRYVNLFTNKLLNKKNRKYMLGLILLFFWTFFSIVINNSNDFGFFKTFFSAVVNIIIFMFLSILILKSKKSTDCNLLNEFIHYYIISNVLNVISTLVLVFFPRLKFIWFSMINMDTLEYNLVNGYAYRNRICISGFSGFDNTLLCTISIILCLYVITNMQKNKIKYIVYMGVCLIGNFFYGRMGLGISAICLVLYIIYYRKVKIKYLFVVLFIAFVIVLGGKFLMTINNNFNVTLTWATKPFIEFLQTGSMNDDSFNNMMSMRFMPEIKTFFIGDGRYRNSNGGYYMNTDLGFMRLMLQGGIISCIIVYSMLLSGIINFSKDKIYFFLSMIITTIAFEFKGEVWSNILSFLIVYSMLFELSDGNNNLKYVDLNKKGEINYVPNKCVNEHL